MNLLDISVSTGNGKAAESIGSLDLFYMVKIKSEIVIARQLEIIRPPSRTVSRCLCSNLEAQFFVKSLAFQHVCYIKHDT